MSSPADEKLRALRRQVRNSPRSVRALAALGAELRQSGAHREAEAYSRRALAVAPDDPQALAVLGGLLQLEGRFAEGLELADAAIKVNPRSGAAWLARGDSLMNSGAAGAAADAYERAAEDPNVCFDARVRLGRAHQAAGNVEQALAAFDAAESIDPTSPLPRFHRGILRLSMRDFAAGWAEYEARWRTERFVAASRGFVAPGMIPHLAVSPSRDSLAGQRVLLVGEQGIGDQIMFASMIPDLTATAATVVCVCEPRLMDLFALAFPDVAFVHPSGAQVEADVLLAMGSLGCAFRPDEAAFPGWPYLQAPQPALEKWAARLGKKSKRLRVGLSWSGGTPATRRVARSIDLSSFSPVLDLPDCEFISLQYGEVAAEIEVANASRSNPIRYFPADDLRDFADLAGLIANLDAVVSVQTTAVHLSGALGKTCLTLVPTDPEWRYQRQGDSMPWYGSVRLFRQTSAGDWGGVLQRTAVALADLQA